MIILGVAIIGALIAFGVLGTLVGRTLIRSNIAAFHNEVVISLFAAAGVVYAVLLGFLVVVVWEAYDDAHRNLADEAATLVPLYRLTYGMEAKEAAQLRRIIRGYTHAVIDDEWPTLGTSRAGSNSARKAIGDIDRVFAIMDAHTKDADRQIDSEFLRTKSKVVADRNQRLLEATDSIPWVMWLGAIGGAAIVMCMSFFMYMQAVWPHVLMSGLMGALIGLLLFIMAVLSRPFTGPLPLGPEHFQSALQVMDDADKGD